MPKNEKSNKRTRPTPCSNYEALELCVPYATRTKADINLKLTSWNLPTKTRIVILTIIKKIKKQGTFKNPKLRPAYHIRTVRQSKGFISNTIYVTF